MALNNSLKNITCETTKPHIAVSEKFCSADFAWL